LNNEHQQTKKALASDKVIAKAFYDYASKYFLYRLADAFNLSFAFSHMNLSLHAP
jgi:hypothetical protein